MQSMVFTDGMKVPEGPIVIGLPQGERDTE